MSSQDESKVHLSSDSRSQALSEFNSYLVNSRHRRTLIGFSEDKVRGNQSYNKEQVSSNSKIRERLGQRKQNSEKKFRSRV